MKVLRALWALLVLQAQERWSYGFARLTTYLGVLLALGVILYIGKLVESGRQFDFGSAGYLGFAAVGMTIANFGNNAATAAASGLREGQLTGALEGKLSAPFRGWVLATLMTIAATVSLLPRLAVELVLAAVVGVHFDIDWAKLACFVVLFASALMPFGLLACAATVLLKRGDPVTYTVSAMTALLSGVYFPRTLLPESLVTLGELLPITHAVQLGRDALLGGIGAGETGGAAVRLLLTGAAFWVLGVTCLAFAFKFGKLRGNLSHY